MRNSITIAFVAAGITLMASSEVLAATDKDKFLEEGFVVVDAKSMDWIGSWNGVNTKGKPYKFELIKDGTATFRFGNRSSAGRWSIEDAKLCTAWKEFRPKKRCDAIYNRGDEYRALKPDGKSSGSISKIN